MMVFCDVCNVCVHQVGVTPAPVSSFIYCMHTLAVLLSLKYCINIYPCKCVCCTILDIFYVCTDADGTCSARCRPSGSLQNCSIPSCLPPKACYGVGSIPDGSWLCDVCRTKEATPKCALCPNMGGAMKQTGWVCLLIHYCKTSTEWCCLNGRGYSASWKWTENFANVSTRVHWSSSGPR